MRDKHKRFADEYLTDFNGTRAYMEVYNVERKAAGKRASELLKKDEIRAYIDSELEKIHSSKTADAKEIMEFLTSVMRREKNDTVVVKTKDERVEYVPDENGDMKRQVVKREVPVMVEIPAKLSDANRAAALLGKRYRLFTDRVQVEGAGRVVIEGEECIE